MKCDAVKVLLSTYFDGELPERDAAEVKLHLLTCADCQLELASYERMSDMLRAPLGGAPDNWARISTRLEEDDNAVVPSSLIKGRSLKHRFPVFVAILAASLLFIAALSTNFHGTHPHASTAAVDLSEYVELAAEKPSLALQTMEERFKGQEVKLDHAKEVLGYEPAIASSLPSSVKLVSTTALTLPGCDCGAGKCTCGPNGCNCAASLCRREDGTEFLVLEHCKTQELTFGDLPTQIASRGPSELRVVEAGEKVAATWNTAERKVTALGLKDIAEAKELSATTRNLMLLN